jgi:DNA-directed RNA polymerase sigma subunit (sigma70/sigma32)
MYFNETGKSNEIGYELSLGAGQQQALMNLFSNGDTSAKHETIDHEQQLIVNMTGRYANRGVAPFKRLKKRNLGLINALETCEVKSGTGFLTHVTECMQQNHHEDSFQSKPAYVLTFDNPAHERRMK